MNLEKSTRDLDSGTVENNAWNMIKAVGTKVLDAQECIANAALGSREFLEIISKQISKANTIFDTANCLASMIVSGARKKRSPWNENADAALVRVSFIVKAMYNYREMIGLIYGNPAWFDINCVDRSWENALTRAQEATSDFNYFISAQEYNELMLIPHRCANQSSVSDYVLYYNRTRYWYSINITEPNSLSGTPSLFMSLSALVNRTSQYQKDLNYSRTLGYSNLFDAYFGIFKQYYDENKDSPAGTCATVTIRIVQNVTITRQAFDAELMIDNSGTDNLYDIQVILDIQTEDQLNATDRFSIGQVNITGDIFNGSLAAGGSGQFNWLIIPYLSAAPTASKWYSVGGQLSYTIDGQRVNITLYPDRIQVDPEARLDVAYLLEQQVIGPDPLSTQWIAPQPFILAVIITNNGYGSAKNFRVASAQPEIIENEKGLLINFNITGMRVNEEEQTVPELSASLGDLPPFSSFTVTWIMVATLKGYFRKFNASYTQTNPNGDSKLSLLNSLTTNRLEHVVSLDILIEELNDSRIDYLVNQPDGTQTVHTSTNATTYFPVVIIAGIVQYFSVNQTIQRLVVTANTSNSSFIHITINNLYPESAIISAKRTMDNYDVIKNTWLTHHVDHLINTGDKREDLLHIFDWSSTLLGSYEIILSMDPATESSTTQSTFSTSGTETITYITTLPTISTTENSSMTAALTTASTTDTISTLTAESTTDAISTLTTLLTTDTTSTLSPISTTDTTSTLTTASMTVITSIPETDSMTTNTEMLSSSSSTAITLTSTESLKTSSISFITYTTSNSTNSTIYFLTSTTVSSTVIIELFPLCEARNSFKKRALKLSKGTFVVPVTEHLIFGLILIYLFRLLFV